MTKLSALLRRKREENGLTKTAVASQLTPKTSIQFVYNVEFGKTPLPPDRIHQWAKILGITGDEIIAAMGHDYVDKVCERVK